MADYSHQGQSTRACNECRLSALCVDRPLLLLSRVDAVLGDDHGPVSAFLLGTIAASVAGGKTLIKVRTMRTRLRTPNFLYN